MQLAMTRSNPAANRKNFFAMLIAHATHSSGIIDRDFDEYDKPITAEPLDWHLARHWPSVATD